MLNENEKRIIDLMQQARQGCTSAYDEIIFSNNPKAQREMFRELQWQIMNGPGEDLVKYYGVEAVQKLTLLKITE